MTRVALSLCMIGLTDLVSYQICRCNQAKDLYFSTTIRWFMIHSMTNIIIGLLCIPGVMQFWNHPESSFDSDGLEDMLLSPTSKWPLTLTVVLHMYHIMAGFRLSAQDWFHHIVFIPTLAFPGMIYDWGCFCNWFAFFICGIPGAIDYAILALQKMNMAVAYNQKRISANLNIWVRLPGIIFGVGIGFILFRQKRYRVPDLAILCQLILMPLNAIYYSKQSIINYVLHVTKKYIPEDKKWKELKSTCSD